MPNLAERINGLNIDETRKSIIQKIVAELLSIIAKKDKVILTGICYKNPG